jgi:hypothetical protein
MKRSRGDRYLSHSSRHTQVPVPATIAYEKRNVICTIMCEYIDYVVNNRL